MDEFLRLTAEGDRNGLITTKQLRACGYDVNGVTALVRSDTIRRVRRGWFVLADMWPADREGQHRLETIAITRSYDGRVAASHHSAALLHGLPLYRCDLNTVRVVRTDSTPSVVRPKRPSRSRLVVSASVNGSLITDVDRIKCVTPATAGLQIAMRYGISAGVVALDSALHRKLCSDQDVKDAGAALAHQPRLHRAEVAAMFCDGRAESPGESRLRLVLRSLGYQAEPQVWLTQLDGSRVRVDFLMRDHNVIIEFDGAIKYRTDDTNDGRDELSRERWREEQLHRQGYEFARISWSDLDHPERVRAKIEAAIARARSRAGSPAQLQTAGL